MTDPDDIDPPSPEWPTAFDSEHRPIPIAHPMGEPDHWQWRREGTTAQRHSLQEGLRRFIEMLVADDTDPRVIGERALLIAWLAGTREFDSQSEMAVRLGITPARLTQIRNEVTDIFPSLGRLKRRQCPSSLKVPQ